MSQNLITRQQFAELIGQIYEGPLEKSPWSTSLRQLRSILNANIVTLAIRQTTFAMPGVVLSSGRIPRPLVDAYHSQFFSEDPFVDLPADMVVTSDEIFSRDDWISRAFYKDYLNALDVYRIMGADIDLSDDMTCPLRISRPHYLPEFSAAEKNLCNQLLPHFGRSVRIYRKMFKERSLGSLFEETIDNMAVGAVILDEDLKILKVNGVANELLEKRNGVALKNGKLGAVFGVDEARLNECLKNAQANSVTGQQSTVEVLTISGKTSRLGLSIAVHSIPAGRWSVSGSRPAVAVFFRDVVQRIEAQDEIVGKLFDLTPSEASLAIKLMNGMTLDEAAESAAIKRNTARAHLRSIFSKLDVSRQSDLVRVLLNSLATLRG